MAKLHEQQPFGLEVVVIVKLSCNETIGPCLCGLRSQKGTGTPAESPCGDLILGDGTVPEVLNLEFFLYEIQKLLRRHRGRESAD